MLASAALPAALVCALVLSSSGEVAPEFGGAVSDSSWDLGYDRWERKHAFVNGLPSVERPTRGLLGEAAGDPFGLVTAKKTPARKINCGKAHVANQYACDAYGEHSPVCTGSQVQYVLKCGHVPKPLFSQQDTNERLMAHRFLSMVQEQTGVAPPTHKLLGDNAAMGGSNRTSNSTSNSTEKPVPMKSQEEILAPILVGCQRDHDQAKYDCKKSVDDGYMAFKSGNLSGAPLCGTFTCGDTQVEPCPPCASSDEQGEDDTVQKISDDLGSAGGIDRVYSRAIDAFHRQTKHNAKQQLKRVAPPSEDVAAAAKFANDELFDHLRTFKHVPNVEEMAVGDDESLADYPSASLFGPY